MASLLTQAGESAPVFGAGAISGLQSEGDIVDFEIKRAKVINLGRRCTMTRQKGKGAHMRRVRWMHWCAFLLMLFLAAPVGTASAQQATGFYVSAYTGYVVPQNMNWDVTTAGVSFDVDTDSTGILGFKVGWVPPAAKYLALEMDFNYIFESNYGPTTVSGVTESGDIYLSNVLFNLLLRYPDGRIHPYIGGGIGWSYFNIEGFETVGGIPYYASEDAYSFAWQFLAGIDFDISPNLSVDLCYRYYGTDPSLLITDIEYRASIFTVGLNFRF